MAALSAWVCGKKRNSDILFVYRKGREGTQRVKKKQDG